MVGGSKFYLAFGVGTLCWCTSAALCSTLYGHSLGDSDFGEEGRGAFNLFWCDEGAFLRSVVVGAYTTNVVNLQSERSDGSLSDVWGSTVPSRFAASCPDAEEFGIQRIDVDFDNEGFYGAEIYCTGDQDCEGYVCEDDEDNRSTCTPYGKAERCGPIGR